MVEENAGRSAPEEIQYRPKGFWALIATQFQGAFNDNVYQWLIVLSLIATLSTGADAGQFNFAWAGLDLSWTGFNLAIPGVALSLAPYDYVSGISRVLFSLPFILFPSLFGALSDRYSKGNLATATKVLEVGIMVAGGIAFLYGNTVIIWCLLFLMATQSAMFGPVKYGIMPEIMPERRLSWGNGILQMGTIAAIILGVLAAGQLHGLFSERLYIVSGFLVLLSAAGMLSSFFITRPPAANPAMPLPMNPLLPWKGLGRYFGIIWRDRMLFNVVVGYIYFWFAGSLVQQNLVKFGGDTLALSESLQMGLIGAVILGIGIGAVAAGFLSRGKIEMGLVPIGAAGMALFGVLLAIPATTFAPAAESAAGGPGGYFYFVVFTSFSLGFFAGVFDVPLAAAIQNRAPRGAVGGVIATTNMLTFVGMAISGLTFMGLGLADFSTYQVFLVTALMSLGMGIYICLRLPYLILRAGLWILANTYFRLRVAGRGHLPEEGPMLLVGPHISFFDGLAFFAATDREIHFVMGEAVYDRPVMGRLARLLHIIPVKAHATEADQVRLAQQIRALLEQNAIVCINNERSADPESTTFAWETDYSVLTGGADVPVVPFYQTRMWESLYVFRDGRVQWRRPKHLPYPIDIRFGTPMPGDTSVETVKKTIRALGGEVHRERPLHHSLLHHGFIKMARRNLRKTAVADALSGQLSYFKTLTGSIVFARKLKTVLDGQPMVGVLLPPSVGGILANVALMMIGRVPINLNYTANDETLASCAEQCQLTQVLTSRKVLERLPLTVPGTPLFLEDIKANITGKDRIIAMLIALCCPISLLDRLLGVPPRTPDDLATVIFSSGSEGTPKGVMLTHRNIITNIDATLEVFPNDENSCIIGFLPFFHSFGFTATLWLTLTHGIRGVYHANPLEPKQIGKLAAQYRGTIMIGTSTFMQGFIRRCEPETLATLEFVVCGAEKLAPRIRNSFKEKFGLEPLEGYGTTECAPSVSANIPDNVSPGYYSPGTRHGTIGRPIPGEEIKIVSTEDGRELPSYTDGLLLVRGPNVMLGYLNRPEKTSEVLRDGWYSTGDVAQVDIDGFITITDRLARFSKIGGEMVPHTRVEEILHTLLALTEQRMAVSSVPDEQKGERLVVLHTLEADELEQLSKALPRAGIPNLWAPRLSAFYHIEVIPVLGTGKLDIRKLRQMALDRGARR